MIVLRLCDRQVPPRPGFYTLRLAAVFVKQLAGGQVQATLERKDDVPRPPAGTDPHRRARFNYDVVETRLFDDLETAMTWAKDVKQTYLSQGWEDYSDVLDAYESTFSPNASRD